MPHRPASANDRPAGRPAAKPLGSGSATPARAGYDLAIFLIAAAAPLAIVGRGLALDLWGDEVYTLVHFAASPWSDIVAGPWQPNNHLAYTLLLKSWMVLSNEPAWLRLPGLGLALLALGGVYRLVAASSGRAAGACAVVLLGLSPMFFTHVMQLRGYGLTLALFPWLLAAAMHKAQQGQWLQTLAVVCSGWLFLYTLPTNLLWYVPMAAVAVWRATRGPGRLRAISRAVFTWSGPLVLAGLAYWPLASEIRAASAAPPRSVQAYASLAQQVCWAATRDLWPLAPLWVWGLVLLVRRELVRRKDSGSIAGELQSRGLEPFSVDTHCIQPTSLGRKQVPDPLVFNFAVPQASIDRRAPIWLATLCVALGTLVLTVVLGVLPFVRNFAPMVEVTAMVVAELLVAASDGLLCRLAGRWPVAGHARCRAGLPALMVGALLLPAALSYPFRLEKARAGQRSQDGYFNYYAARYEPAAAIDELARRVGPTSAYLVLCDEADFHVCEYYLARRGLLSGRLATLDDGRQQAVVFYLGTSRPEYRFAAARAGLEPDQLAQLPVVAQRGFYELRQSPAPILVRIAPAQLHRGRAAASTLPVPR